MEDLSRLRNVLEKVIRFTHRHHPSDSKSLRVASEPLKPFLSTESFLRNHVVHLCLFLHRCEISSSYPESFSLFLPVVSQRPGLLLSAEWYAALVTELGLSEYQNSVSKFVENPQILKLFLENDRPEESAIFASKERINLPTISFQDSRDNSETKERLRQELDPSTERSEQCRTSLTWLKFNFHHFCQGNITAKLQTSRLAADIIYQAGGIQSLTHTLVRNGKAYSAQEAKTLGSWFEPWTKALNSLGLAKHAILRAIVLRHGLESRVMNGDILKKMDGDRSLSKVDAKIIKCLNRIVEGADEKDVRNLSAIAIQDPGPVLRALCNMAFTTKGQASLVAETLIKISTGGKNFPLLCLKDRDLLLSMKAKNSSTFLVLEIIEDAICSKPTKAMCANIIEFLGCIVKGGRTVKGDWESRYGLHPIEAIRGCIFPILQVTSWTKKDIEETRLMCGFQMLSTILCQHLPVLSGSPKNIDLFQWQTKDAQLLLEKVFVHCLRLSEYGKFEGKPTPCLDELSSSLSLQVKGYTFIVNSLSKIERDHDSKSEFRESMLSDSLLYLHEWQELRNILPTLDWLTIERIRPLLESIGRIQGRDIITFPISLTKRPLGLELTFQESKRYENSSLPEEEKLLKKSRNIGVLKIVDIDKKTEANDLGLCRGCKIVSINDSEATFANLSTALKSKVDPVKLSVELPILSSWKDVLETLVSRLPAFLPSPIEGWMCAVGLLRNTLLCASLSYEHCARVPWCYQNLYRLVEVEELKDVIRVRISGDTSLREATALFPGDVEDWYEATVGSIDFCKQNLTVKSMEMCFTDYEDQEECAKISLDPCKVILGNPWILTFCSFIVSSTRQQWGRITALCLASVLSSPRLDISGRIACLKAVGQMKSVFTLPTATKPLKEDQSSPSISRHINFILSYLNNFKLLYNEELDLGLNRIVYPKVRTGFGKIFSLFTAYIQILYYSSSQSVKTKVTKISGEVKMPIVPNSAGYFFSKYLLLPPGLLKLIYDDCVRSEDKLGSLCAILGCLVTVGSIAEKIDATRVCESSYVLITQCLKAINKVIKLASPKELDEYKEQIDSIMSFYPPSSKAIKFIVEAVETC